MQNAQLTLLLPDIKLEAIKALQSELSALNLLLKRADVETLSVDSYEKLVCQLFGLDPANELPIAAITGLADGLTTPTGYWLRADPVQLQADLSAVYLAGNSAVQLNEQDISKTNQVLNQLFNQDQLTLYTPAAKRWYLHSEQPVLINTTTLNAATGKNIAAHLPTGAQQNYWRKLLTEAQMLLHNCSTKLNSLWFWGAGQLPAVLAKHHWQTIWADEPLLTGLAKLANINIQTVPADAHTVINAIQNAQPCLISLLSNDNQVDEAAGLMQLENEWLQPLVKALKKKQLQSLALYLGNNKLFHINWKTIRYFWRR